MCYGVDNKRGYYSFGGRNFPSFSTCSMEDTMKTFEDAGFTNLTHEKAPEFEVSPNSLPEWAFHFITGVRQ